MPGTLKDEEEFIKILQNFKFKEEDVVRRRLKDATFDELQDVTKEAWMYARKNRSENLKTFICFFYAGHGAMNNNTQVLILNGEQKEVVDFKTKEKKQVWIYFYDIETRFRRKFTSLDDSCFVWSIYDCCRTILKEKPALLEEQIKNIEQNYAEKEENPESQKEDSTTLKRGDGFRLPQFNFMTIYGCAANSVVDDKNLLVQNIAQEFRLNQKNKSLRFPYCLVNLPKRFRDCLVQTATSAAIDAHYNDADLIELGIDTDDLCTAWSLEKAYLSVDIPKEFIESDSI